MAATAAPIPAAAGQAASLSVDAFNAAVPQAFYLLDSQAEMEALSDAALIVEGVRLPVHSQVRKKQGGRLSTDNASASMIGNSVAAFPHAQPCWCSACSPRC